jgi:2-C-methyl-D-erythritol 4-phosphate cytidylyltransferase
MAQKNTENNIVIVAGGKGLRMGEPIPKQFLPIGNRPVLMHTIESFYKFQSDLHIILVLPESQKAYWAILCETFQFQIPHTIATGGETRFHSVLNGLSHIHNTKGLTGIHDGVRPFVAQSTIKNCYAMAEEFGAVIPVVHLTDSIRELTKTSSLSQHRSNYRMVQTPQVFKTEILIEAYKQDFNECFTDDASVVEAAGYEVHLAEGNPENIKITSPFDMVIAKAFAESKHA